VWDARTGKAVGKPLVHQGRVLSASFSPDGSRVVTASLDNTARVWNARTGKAVGKPLVHQGEVWSASFSPDGSRVVTASLDNTARVWNARTGEPIAGPVRHQGPITAASFSPDGTRIVTASMDGTARVWDAATGEPLAKPLQQPSQLDLVADAVAAFSPDGSRVVTALCDKTAGVWDARTGEPLAVLRDQYAIATAAFSPDGNRIVTIPLDVRGGARVWDSLLFSDAEADTLAELAETAVGFTVTDLGVLVALPDRKERLSHLRSAASAAPDGQATVLSFARWLFSDPWTRTISPLSAVTVPQYICDAIRRGAVEEAQRAFPGHPLLRGSPSPVAVPPECPPSRP
jgi:WD40 repeat protein